MFQFHKISTKELNIVHFQSYLSNPNLSAINNKNTFLTPIIYTYKKAIDKWDTIFKIRQTNHNKELFLFHQYILLILNFQHRNPYNK